MGALLRFAGVVGVLVAAAAGLAAPAWRISKKLYDALHAQGITSRIR